MKSINLVLLLCYFLVPDNNPIDASFLNEHFLPSLDDILNDFANLVRIAADSYDWGSNIHSQKIEKKENLTSLREQIFQKLALISIKIPNDQSSTVADRLNEKGGYARKMYKQNTDILENDFLDLSKHLIRGDEKLLNDSMKRVIAVYMNGLLVSSEHKERNNFLQYFEQHTIEAVNTSQHIDQSLNVWSLSSNQHSFYTILSRIILVNKLEFFVMKQFIRMIENISTKQPQDTLDGDGSYLKLFKETFFDDASRAKSILSKYSRVFAKSYPSNLIDSQLGSTYTSLSPIFQWHSVQYVQHLDIARTTRESWASETGSCKEFHSEHRCLSELRNCRKISLSWITRQPYVEPCEKADADQSSSSLENAECGIGIIEEKNCHYKLCTCQSLESDVDRHFSLRSALSDVHSNKVVTGVRLTKANYTIHIQIQQGQLLKGGDINGSTVEWKPVSNFSPLDYDVEEGEDYHSIAFDNNKVCMSDIDAEQQNQSNYVLTGLRFKLMRRGNSKDLHLEIQRTPYDMSTGTLQVSDSEWVSRTKPEELMENVILKENDLLKETTISKRETKTCVPFVHDQYEYNKDRRIISEIIPKIDIQQVTTFPTVALAGAGLFYNHERQDKIKGGRISFKIFTSSYLVQDLP